MKKRILSVILALACVLSLVTIQADAVDSAEFGWSEMEGDIAMRVTQNGAQVSRLIVGEQYQLQFWLKNIGPYAITLPISWDPAVVTVVNPKTGEKVSSGHKQEGDASGFRAGSKCYESDYDLWTYEPLYWNGRPVYSNTENENGYSYLNNEGGHYRFFYYVDSPNAPAKEQMFLEISFKVIAKGNPNFHISTSSDGNGKYDPAHPKGVSVVIPDGDNGAKELAYRDNIPSPSVTIVTKEEYEEDAKKPINPDDLPIDTNPTEPSQRPTTPDDNNQQPQEPVEEAKLINAKHLTYFPYSSAYETAAVLKHIDGVIAKNSDYILPSNLISGAVNAGGSDKKSLLVKMPDQIIEKDEYALVFNMENVDDMARVGLSMLYVETPWGFVGLNTGLLAEETPDNAEIRLSVKPNGNGVLLAMTVNGSIVTGFHGQVLRIILHYDASAQPAGTTPVPIGQNVFGSQAQEGQPMSINKIDTEHKAIIFLATSFGAYTIENRAEEKFNDMENTKWAEEYVNKLAQNKVINGVGDKKFAPEEQVKREEFAKLIVSALGMYKAEPELTALGRAAENAANGYLYVPELEFTDVDKGAYYAPYVTSARDASLVNGIGGDKFGVGGHITREDLVVMSYRGLQQLGVTLPSVRQAPNFADAGEISEYAMEAINALYSAGIIDGVDENAFAPKGTATRAQAAKIICGVMEQAGSLL